MQKRSEQLRKIDREQKRLKQQKEAIEKVQKKRHDALKQNRLEHKRATSARVIEQEKKKMETVEKEKNLLKSEKTTNHNQRLINALTDWKNKAKNDRGKILTVRKLSSKHDCPNTTLQEWIAWSKKNPGSTDYPKMGRKTCLTQNEIAVLKTSETAKAIEGRATRRSEIPVVLHNLRQQRDKDALPMSDSTTRNLKTAVYGSSVSSLARPLNRKRQQAIANPRGDVSHAATSIVALKGMSPRQVYNFDSTPVQVGDSMDATDRAMVTEGAKKVLDNLHQSVHVEARVQQLQQRSIPTHVFLPCEGYPPTVFYEIRDHNITEFQGPIEIIRHQLYAFFVPTTMTKLTKEQKIDRGKKLRTDRKNAIRSSPTFEKT